jgi:FkbM family methyltransferase
MIFTRDVNRWFLISPGLHMFKNTPWIYPRLLIWLAIRSQKVQAREKSLKLSAKGSRIRISNPTLKSQILIDWKHRIYLGDMIGSFDYYHHAVKSEMKGNYKVVDYSKPKFHKVVDFDDFPIFFPSLAEPVFTTNQYIDFANLKPGDTVIDLGAYSGLTSILFKMVVGKNGQVIAVEADDKNLIALDINVSNFKKKSGEDIKLIRGAVWNHNNGVNFCNEGNMGSSATDLIGKRDSGSSWVETLTLSKLARDLNLDSVAFIKCDIEGGESVIFEDFEFLNKYKPRIMVETHPINGKLSNEKVFHDLKKCGYTMKEVNQPGVFLPLIECLP